MTWRFSRVRADGDADPLDWLARLLLLCCLVGLAAAFVALVAGHLFDALCASAFAYVTGVIGALGRRVARSAL